MNRRESLKAFVIGSVSAGAILGACETDHKKPVAKTDAGAPPKLPGYGRTPDEMKRDEGLMEKRFFTSDEMKTITVLADIIIPADEHSCSASEAGVPEFIEFFVKDQPRYQLPMQGGLRWLDVHCAKTYNNRFIDCTQQQQIAVIDQIAYPEQAAPENSQGVSFFNLMRDLTANGFFTSKPGIKDMDYRGNTPNEWDGVPEDVLKQYGVAYDEKMLAVCLKKEDRSKIMTWD
jgi:gluconate 2-dehydrogenase gamma chain